MTTPSTYTIYRQWWRDHYGYECPISEAAFERYLHLDRPRAQPGETFSKDEWAPGEMKS